MQLLKYVTLSMLVVMTTAWISGDFQFLFLTLLYKQAYLVASQMDVALLFYAKRKTGFGEGKLF